MIATNRRADTRRGDAQLHVGGAGVGQSLAIRSILEELDPDVEDDIRRGGVHLVRGGQDAAWTGQLARLLELPVFPATGPQAVLIDGINVNRALSDRDVDATQPPNPIGRVMARLRPTLSG